MSTVAATGSTHWADMIVTLVRQEIDGGRLVRVSLPGSKVPILVEDAMRWAQTLAIRDPQGGRYYLADPAGVVVICDPVQPLGPDEVPFYMEMDQ